MTKWRASIAGVMAMLLAQASALPAAVSAQSPAPGASGPGAADPDARPYDTQIYRLAEILGAIHYLRELCSGDEGQLWREQMRQLVAAEGTSALRRAKLVDSFNRGYRGYARTYRTCTPPALSAIERFMQQGAELADAMIENNR
jgi:uncharacterized protein (TIGR02301 family)